MSHKIAKKIKHGVKLKVIKQYVRKGSTNPVALHKAKLSDQR